MNYGFFFKGQPRNWYVIPFVAGLILALFAILIVIFPALLAYLVAIPLFLIGLALMLIGLDLWRGMHYWRNRLQATLRRRNWSRRDTDSE